MARPIKPRATEAAPALVDKRWMVTVHYMDLVGSRAMAIRYFHNRADAELSLADYLNRGLLLPGNRGYMVIPAHQIVGIQFVDLEAPDAHP